MKRKHRRGTATVEFAIVAIPLFLLIFASIEFGRAMMAMQGLEEAARAGCRKAVLKGSTPAEVESTVDDILLANGIGVYAVDVTPTNLDTATRWEPITVTVSASFAELSWLPLPMYFQNTNYSARSTLPREAEAID